VCAVAAAKRWLVLYKVTASSLRYFASVTPGPCHDRSVDAANTHTHTRRDCRVVGSRSRQLRDANNPPSTLMAEVCLRMVELALCGTRSVVQQCSRCVVRRDIHTKVQRVVNIMMGISIYTKMQCCNMPFDKHCHLARQSSPGDVAWSCVQRPIYCRTGRNQVCILAERRCTSSPMRHDATEWNKKT
jgi:hypothetical protein